MKTPINTVPNGTETNLSPNKLNWVMNCNKEQLLNLCREAMYDIDEAQQMLIGDMEVENVLKTAYDEIEKQFQVILQHKSYSIAQRNSLRMTIKHIRKIIMSNQN